VFTTSGTFEVKPLFITTTDFAKDKTRSQIVRRFFNINREEIGTLKKTQRDQNLNP